MEDQNKLSKNLKKSDEQFLGITGIIPAKHQAASSHYTSGSSSDDDIDDDLVYGAYKDPVPPHNKEAIWDSRPRKEKPPIPKKEESIAPSISLRIGLKGSKERIIGTKYVVPQPKGSRKAAKERREKIKELRNFCEYEVLKVASPSEIGYIPERVKLESPQVSKAKVPPRRPSFVPDAIYPYPQSPSHLESTKPKSGIYINVKESIKEEPMGPFVKQVPTRQIKKEKKEKVNDIKGEEIEKISKEDYEAFLQDYMEYAGEEEELGIHELTNRDVALSAMEEMRIRRVHSHTSAQTSINSHDIEPFEDTSWAKIPIMTKLVQTFRNENDEPLPKKPKKGTIENHSFTKLHQRVPREFCFKTTCGIIHQGIENFCPVSRNHQGICMCVAAFCYASIYRPKTWTEVMVDDIVEIGDEFYLNCIAELHLHRKSRELIPAELNKYIFIEDQRVKFHIDDPAISGHVRTKDRLVFNILKGMRLFFKRHRAGIVQSKDLSVMVWRQKKRYYMFDAYARRKDLYRDPNGTAMLVTMQSLKAVVAILLHRTDLDKAAFNICHIQIKKILGKEQPDEEEIFDSRSVYQILSEKKAVVQASFDLGDKCFQFTRNKQALAMALVALVYAKITPPSTWRRKTVDKVMIVGNQLYKECCDFESIQELKVQNLPAVFTIGPYMCEVYIYVARFADSMFTKGVCSFGEALTEYFDDSTNAIVQIGRSFIAVWQQRGLYYIFDPYSRNADALECRRGVACTSMNSDISTVIETIVTNFPDKETIFYIHALKVLKIHRDPALSRLFPTTTALNDVPVETFRRSRVKKSKKKAIERPVRTNFTEYAMKKLLAGEDPEPSILEIGSNVFSLHNAYIPEFVVAARKEITQTIEDMDLIVDLDSPSLSDTQMNPIIPCSCKREDEITFQDLDSYQLTAEELEGQDKGEGEGGMMEGEGEEKELLAGGDFEGEDEIMLEEEKYFVKDAASQVHSTSIEPSPEMVNDEMNTDVSYQYKVLPALEYPLKQKKPKGIIVDSVAQEEELKKPSHYKLKRDTFQILWAMAKNNELRTIRDYGDDDDVVAPYMNIMATAFSQEVPIGKWNRKHVEYLLRAGSQLYEEYKEPYNVIDDFEFEFHKTNFTATIEKTLDTYVGRDLCNTEMGRHAISRFLEQHIFNDSDFGIVIINNFCLSVFMKRNLFYMFDCYPCNKIGSADEHPSGMSACVTRYPSLDDLLVYLLYNLQIREEGGKDYGDYRKVILLKPRFTGQGLKQSVKEEVFTTDDTLTITQSKELARPSNFVDLPDDSQIVRGTTDVANFGPDVEFTAPFVCVVAAAVAAKYSINSWSKQVVNYALRCGSELYKKSKIRYDQVAKLEIPKVSLGSTDYSITVDYLIDSPLKFNILESTIRKVLRKPDYWAIIVTKSYACAAFYYNELLYLYEPFPCNELGLSEGPDGVGTACVSRFKNLKALVERIMYNKNKLEHDDGKHIEYTKFILSRCKATRIIPPVRVKKEDKRKKRPASAGSQRSKDKDYYEGGEEEYVDYDKAEEEGEDEGEEEPKPKQSSEKKVGYQKKSNIWVIEGTKSLPPVTSLPDGLGEDHFACLCACLMAIDKPVAKWDTKRVDQALEQGEHIFHNADNLEVSDKRTIKNILVGTHFFDIIVRMVHIALWKDNRNVEVGLSTILRKRKYIIVQFPNCAYVVYNDEGCIHLFSPYATTHKINKKESLTVKAGWQRFQNDKKLKQAIRANMADGVESYFFYTFDVISVRKAQKKFLLRHRIDQYHVEPGQKGELLGKPFHEQESWLNLHQSPWSRIDEQMTASKKPRGRSENKWHNWDVEYPNDLFSLMGTIPPASHMFKPRNRGKQTLANMVVAIAMTSIYEFCEWNSAVVDNILICGDAYFNECFKDIKSENYELAIDDLKPKCTVFPYTFNVKCTPLVEGTMFVSNPRAFNLYRALRYFFDGFDRRCGVICASKTLKPATTAEPSIIGSDNQHKATVAESPAVTHKRHLAFGKTGEKEYFVYDCQALGPPMFAANVGVGYVVRCTTQARLLHAMVVTLRGGDFYLTEIATSDFEAIME